MSTKFASRRSHKVFTATGSGGALTVASGSPVQVCGIAFTSVTTSIFTVTDADDTTLFIVAATAGTTRQVSVPWLADNGIKVQNSQTDGSVVVFHNSPGN
jgi:hypothetical protein